MLDPEPASRDVGSGLSRRLGKKKLKSANIGRNDLFLGQNTQDVKSGSEKDGNELFVPKNFSKEEEHQAP